MKRVAIYLRVSTGEQTAGNQLGEILALCKHYGFAHPAGALTFEETASGASAKRPQFDAMMEAARARRLSHVVVWSLDRFGRTMAGNMAAVLELDRLGVEVLSVREPWLSTREAPTRNLLVAIFSWVAEQERAQIRARTMAGMERARAQGKRIGRPPRLTRVEVARVRGLHADGYDLRRIAQIVKVPRSTLQRALARKGGVKIGPKTPGDSGGRLGVARKGSVSGR